MILLAKFLAVNKWVRYLFLFAFGYILLVELWLKKIENPYSTLVILGDIGLKLCYSYTAGFIFFFIATYLEKDRKKATLYWMLQQKTMQINTEISDVFASLFANTGLNTVYSEKITFQELKENLAAVNSDTPIVSKYDNLQFANAYEFLFYKKQRIKSLISDLYHFADYMDNDFLNYLSNIDIQLMDINVFNFHKRLKVSGLAFADNTFQMLHDHSWDIKNRLEKTTARLQKEYYKRAKKYRKSKGWDRD